uniref:Uncharacterized protein n=1 Tax=Neobodo designis TaxID=312471 RepID=A0A7S1Q5F8_NEODS
MTREGEPRHLDPTATPGSPGVPEALTPSALLKRLHDIERAAAQRERRDAALVARLQREVCELEEKLLEAYAAGAGASSEQLPGSGASHERALSGSPWDGRSPSHSVRRESCSAVRNLDSHTDDNAELREIAAAPGGESSIAAREERLAADRDAFQAQVARLEDELAAWEGRVRAGEEALAAERQALERERKAMRAEFAAERADVAKQRQALVRLEAECRGLAAAVGPARRRETSRKVAPPPATAAMASSSGPQRKSDASAGPASAQPSAPSSRSASVAKRNPNRSRGASQEPKAKNRSASAHADGTQRGRSRGRSPSPKRPPPKTNASGPGKSASPEVAAVAALSAEIDECDRVLKDARARKVAAQAQRSFLAKRVAPGQAS